MIIYTYKPAKKAENNSNNTINNSSTKNPYYNDKIDVTKSSLILVQGFKFNNKANSNVKENRKNHHIHRNINNNTSINNSIQYLPNNKKYNNANSSNIKASVINNIIRQNIKSEIAHSYNLNNNISNSDKNNFFSNNYSNNCKASDNDKYISSSQTILPILPDNKNLNNNLVNSSFNSNKAIYKEKINYTYQQLKDNNEGIFINKENRNKINHNISNIIFNTNQNIYNKNSSMTSNVTNKSNSNNKQIIYNQHYYNNKLDDLKNDLKSLNEENYIHSNGNKIRDSLSKNFNNNNHYLNYMSNNSISKNYNRNTTSNSSNKKNGNSSNFLNAIKKIKKNEEVFNNDISNNISVSNNKITAVLNNKSLTKNNNKNNNNNIAVLNNNSQPSLLTISESDGTIKNINNNEDEINLISNKYKFSSISNSNRTNIEIGNSNIRTSKNKIINKNNNSKSETKTDNILSNVKSILISKASKVESNYINSNSNSSTNNKQIIKKSGLEKSISNNLNSSTNYESNITLSNNNDSIVIKNNSSSFCSNNNNYTSVTTNNRKLLTISNKENNSLNKSIKKSINSNNSNNYNSSKIKSISNSTNKENSLVYINNKTNINDKYRRNSYTNLNKNGLLQSNYNNITSNNNANNNNINSNNKYNISIIKEKEEKKNKKYILVLKNKNNPELIRQIFASRTNWIENPVFLSANYHLKWGPSRKKLEFNLMNGRKMVNHFEFEHSISNKKYLFLNILEYCDSIGINPFSFIPLTIIMRYNSSTLKDNVTNFKYLFNNINNFREKSNSNNNSNSSSNNNNFYSDIFSLEHREYVLTNKTTSCVSISDSYLYENNVNNKKTVWILKPSDLFGGKCIQIINNCDDIEKLLRKFFEGIEKKIILEDEAITNNNNINNNINNNNNNINNNNENSDDEDSSSDEEDEIKKKIVKEKGKDGKDVLKYRTTIVLLQKYLEKPFLYYGRKFDIRMWVLITHQMKVYVFKEGHLKTTSAKYDYNSTSKFIHITNYCLQKHNEDFNKYEEGNEVSYSKFQKFLDEQWEYEKRKYSNKENDCSSNKKVRDTDNTELNDSYYNNKKYNKNLSVKDDLYPQMFDIIKLTINAVKNKINKKKRKHCFLVLGYDFIVDENFKVWLLEVNKNSGLTISSNVIKALVPRMIDDCVKLTVDTVFETENIDNGVSRFPVEGYSDKENMWMNLYEETCY